MQINSSTPRATQNFGAAMFFKVPTEMQEVMKANATFSKIAKEQEIVVTARPRATFRDPFGLRTPKADEKCYLDYEIMTPETPLGWRINAVTTDSKLFAPLKAHVQSLLERLEVERIMNNWF